MVDFITYVSLLSQESLWDDNEIMRCVVLVYLCVSYILRVLHSENLLSEVLKVIEGRLSCDGVNQSEALTVLHVQVSHGRELLLKTDRETDRWSGRFVLDRHRHSTQKLNLSKSTNTSIKILCYM